MPQWHSDGSFPLSIKHVMNIHTCTYYFQVLTYWLL
jgi:hypothetical protein